MRVLTGGFTHETSTFTPVETTEVSFTERFGDLELADTINTFRGANIPIGGFIDGAEAHGFELVPTIYAHAQPSGRAPRDVFDRILNRMLDCMAKTGKADGVLLELHGSMAAEGIDDADGHILAAVRKLVGPDVPIVAQLDIHSNVSQQMVEQADVLIGRETYPEVDMAERGRECADVLVRIVREGLKPTMALAQIPMMWGMNQITAHPPMTEAITELHRIESQAGVVCGSIATCFPLADVADMGASVYVVTDNDQPAAQAHADRLARWSFDRRADWHSPPLTTREALDAAHANGRFPVIIADRNDNTGGGSPGDSTGMLRAFIDTGLKDVCVLYIVDPDAIAKCQAAGVGKQFTLDVGGKSTPIQGPPVSMNAHVVALSDGRFRYAGPMYANLPGDMGPSAYIRQDGLHVILVTVREQPFDTAFAHTMGLKPAQMRYIGVKSAAHFRAGFESWAEQIYCVFEPGLHAAESVQFKNLGRKVYPLDLD